MNLNRVSVTMFVIISLLSIQLNANNIVKSKELDSIDALFNKLLSKGNKAEAMKVMKDKGKMLHQQSLHTNAIISIDRAIKLSNDGKDTLRYPGMKELYMECLNVKSVTYSYLSKYDDAIKCCIEMDKYNKDNNPIYKTKFYNGMGAAFAMSGKLNQAKEYYNQAILSARNIKGEDDKNNQLFIIFINTGGIFMSQCQFDSVQIYLMEAQKLSIQQKNKKNELMCLHLFGLMNENMGKIELAVQYYNESYKLAMESGNYYIFVFLKLRLSECYLKLKDYKLAQRLAFEGLKLARETKQTKIEIALMFDIAEIYRQIGDINNALKYMTDGNKIKDSLFSLDNEDRFLSQKADFDAYKISIEKRMLDENLKLQESQRLINKLMIFIIILFLISTLAFLLHRLLKQYKRGKQERLQFIDEKRNFQDEIEKKDNAILMSSLSLAKSDELIPLMTNKLKALKTNLPLKGKGSDIIKEIEEMLSQLSRENNVAELNECLRQVHSNFYDRLDILFPELTIGEKKICGLISLGISVNEIANMMGKSTGAMAIIKFRIRKKIKADTELNLCEYFIKMRE